MRFFAARTDGRPLIEGAGDANLTRAKPKWQVPVRVAVERGDFGFLWAKCSIAEVCGECRRGNKKQNWTIKIASRIRIRIDCHYLHKLCTSP